MNSGLWSTGEDEEKETKPVEVDIDAVEAQRKQKRSNCKEAPKSITLTMEATKTKEKEIPKYSHDPPTPPNASFRFSPYNGFRFREKGIKTFWKDEKRIATRKVGEGIDLLPVLVSY